MTKILPNDMIQRENIEQHKLIVDVINTNDDNYALLTTKVNGMSSDVEQAIEDSSNAVITANTAKSTADTAKSTADTAQTGVNANSQAITTINATLVTINNKFPGLIKNCELIPGTSTVTLKVTWYDNSTVNLAFPVLSGTLAGVGNTAFYNSVANVISDVASLKSQIKYGPVVYPDANPTQLELQALYDGLRVTYPTLPVTPNEGFTLRDSNNPQISSITYTYSNLGDSYGNHWLANSGTIPQAGTGTMGIVLGLDDNVGHTNDGTIFVELDASMSVIGWDRIVARILALETNSQTKNNLVTTFQTTPDDTHYPSEKLVKDSLTTITNTINGKIIKRENISILSTDWVTNDESTDIYNKGYIYKYKILVTGMTADMIPNGSASLTDYLSKKLWSRYQSSAGGVTIYSKTATATTILWISGTIGAVVS